jgi:ABC-type siderophore export system fused ATPase/permease subunit
MSAKDFFCTVTTQASIAIMVIFGGFMFLAYVEASEVLKTSVVNMMILVLGYYFGSSRSTAKKDETIAEMAQQNQK